MKNTDLQTLTTSSPCSQLQLYTGRSEWPRGRGQVPSCVLSARTTLGRCYGVRDEPDVDAKIRRRHFFLVCLSPKARHGRPDSVGFSRTVSARHSSLCGQSRGLPGRNCAVHFLQELTPRGDAMRDAPELAGGNKYAPTSLSSVWGTSHTIYAPCFLLAKSDRSRAPWNIWAASVNTSLWARRITTATGSH